MGSTHRPYKKFISKSILHYSSNSKWLHLRECNGLLRTYMANLFSQTNLIMSEDDVWDLEVEDAQSQSWAFTLRKTTLKLGPIGQDKYKQHIENLCRGTSSVLNSFVFEYTNGIHMHGILEIPKNAKMFRFRTRGWRLHLEEIYDYAGWNRYMMKEQHLQDEGLYNLKKSLFPDPNIEDAIRSDKEEFFPSSGEGQENSECESGE